VVALTEATASIKGVRGNINIYRKNNKLTLGPESDSLDDFKGNSEQ